MFCRKHALLSNAFFSSLQWKWLLWAVVYEVWKWFLVFPVKALHVFAYGTSCLQLSCSGGFQPGLHGKLWKHILKAGSLSSAPTLQASCYDFFFFKRRCHINNGAWGEVDDQEGMAIGRLMLGMGVGCAITAATFPFLLTNADQGLCYWLPTETVIYIYMF